MRTDSCLGRLNKSPLNTWAFHSFTSFWKLLLRWTKTELRLLEAISRSPNGKREISAGHLFLIAGFFSRLWTATFSYNFMKNCEYNAHLIPAKLASAISIRWEQFWKVISGTPLVLTHANEQGGGKPSKSRHAVGVVADQAMRPSPIWQIKSLISRTLQLRDLFNLVWKFIQGKK